MNYEVDVAFMEPANETVVLNNIDRDQVEFEAMNYIHDAYDFASNVEILEVREIASA